MQITSYALPAVAALLGKAGIYFYARHSKVHNIQTRLYLIFLFCLSIQSFAEITIFSNLAEGVANSPTGGTLWFSATILAIAIFFHLAVLTATDWLDSRSKLSVLGLLLIYGPPVILEVLLWSGPLLIVGFEPMSYTITKIPGPLYVLFELYVIGYLVAASALLIRGTRNRPTLLGRLKNRFLLIGLVPFLVLALAVVGLEHLGFREFNATITLPIATTFFLAITAYAIHQYRLFDIEFFIPWSKVRKRKTALYKRIQALIASIAEMDSVSKIVQSLSDTLHCPIALVGGPKPVIAMAGGAFGVARFPLNELKKIDHIVVANEIADTMPDAYALMRHHNVAAIVPFHPQSQAAASWMLLGDAFSEHVYSPLDFKTVEVLFARLADHFLDNQLLLRAQLVEAQREMDALHGRLANAWEQIEDLRKRLATAEEKGRHLQAKSDMALHGRLLDVQSEILERFGSETKSLDDHVAEFEVRLIAKTLEHCEDDVSRAADLLGLSLANLHYKLRNYHLPNLKKRH